MQPDESTFASFRHLTIDVDDVADEDLLEHFGTANVFIQAGIDSGGGVLVHWLVFAPFPSEVSLQTVQVPSFFLSHKFWQTSMVWVPHTTY